MNTKYTIDNLRTHFILQTYFKLHVHIRVIGCLIYYKKQEKSCQCDTKPGFLLCEHNPFVNPELINITYTKKLGTLYAIFAKK